MRRLDEPQRTGPPGSEDRKRKFISRKTPENRVRKCKPIQQNEQGEVIVPARYGQVTIKSIGRIVSDDLQYHTERYLYPVDYEIERPFLRFASIIFISFAYYFHALIVLSTRQTIRQCTDVELSRPQKDLRLLFSFIII
jgi:hypothetical protein